MITATDLAKDLQVSVKTVYRLVDAGKIPYIKPGRQYRFDLEAVKTALTADKPTATWAQSARSLNRKRVA